MIPAILCLDPAFIVDNLFRQESRYVSQWAVFRDICAVQAARRCVEP
jgi:hypothetical protein